MTTLRDRAKELGVTALSESITPVVEVLTEEPKPSPSALTPPTQVSIEESTRSAPQGENDALLIDLRTSAHALLVKVKDPAFVASLTAHEVGQILDKIIRSITQLQTETTQTKKLLHTLSEEDRVRADALIGGGKRPGQ